MVLAGGQTSFTVGTELKGSGWVYINSDKPLSGLAFLGSFGDSAFMADIPFASKLGTSLMIPHIAASKEWTTTVFLCNPQDQSTTINIKYINTQGVVVNEHKLELAANGCGDYPLSDLFSMPLAGKVYIKASQAIAAFATYSNVKAGGSYYAGINAVAVAGGYKIDVDGDGYSSDVDCNDNDASVHPGAMDICGDGIDQDCSGSDKVCYTNKAPIFSPRYDSKIDYDYDFYGRLMGATLTLTQEVTDPEGDRLSYNWESTGQYGSISSGQSSPTVKVRLAIIKGIPQAPVLELTVMDSDHIIHKTFRIVFR